MRASARRYGGTWSGHLLWGSLVLCLIVMLHQGFPSSASASKPKQQGHAAAGRSVFNGKGVCYYCHGVDGYRDKVPPLEADTAALIARLNPPPADLRDPKRLRLTTDKARAKIIREGHEGTAMFPDTTMTEQELADTLAYLALLRREGAQAHGKGESPSHEGKQQ